MKTLILAIIGLIIAGNAYAGPIEATPSRTQFSSTNVSTSAYTELVSATSKTLKGITVMNSCTTSPLEIALGASGSETTQVIVPASMSTVVYIPMAAPYGSRISVIALDHTASTGELQLNAVY